MERERICSRPALFGAESRPLGGRIARANAAPDKSARRSERRAPGTCPGARSGVRRGVPAARAAPASETATTTTTMMMQPTPIQSAHLPEISAANVTFGRR